MSEQDLRKKLRLLDEHQILVLNAPDGFLDRLSLLPEVGVPTEQSYGFVLAFAKNGTELESIIPEAKRYVIYDGLLWLAYPKRSSHMETDLVRDVVWKAGEQHDLRAVAQIALDDIWSAMRFRPAAVERE